MAATNSPRALQLARYLAPLTLLLLIVQYIAGLGTNVYAPSGGFNQNTAFGVYDAHWEIGYALGVLSILLLVLSALTRRPMFIGLSVVILAAVLGAAAFGMAFVNATPNPPWASLGMGILFLVAFAACGMLAGRLWMRTEPSAGAPSSSAPAPNPGA